jgi:hypothetical protein
MADSYSRLEVRSYAPKRRALMRGLIVLGVLCAMGIAYLAGVHQGPYHMVDSVRAALAANERIRDLEKQNEEQRRQLEAADVARRVDREGYSNVDKSLGDMQNQIARLNQDLNFYRGLVQPDSLVHVKVQQMQIVPQPTAGSFHLKFVLMQTGKPDKDVKGDTVLTIDGTQQGKQASLSFAQVSPNKLARLPYSFKYFQEYDEALSLPQGFEPTRVGVEIHTGRDSVHSFKQAFVWKASGMSMETDATDKGDQDVQTEVE